VAGASFRRTVRISAQDRKAGCFVVPLVLHTFLLESFLDGLGPEHLILWLRRERKRRPSRG